MVPSALLLDALNTPALIVVRPVYRLVPDSSNLPVPVLVRAPDVDALEPEMVKVVAVVVTSIVAVVAFVKVKARSVASVAPVYFSVRHPSLN